jgi:hypothetical protein
MCRRNAAEWSSATVGRFVETRAVPIAGTLPPLPRAAANGNGAVLLNGGAPEPF